LLSKAIKQLLGPRLLNLRFLFSAPLAYAPGHFYSPICDPTELQRRHRDPWTNPLPSELPGIDLAHDAQVRLWETWRPFFDDVREALADAAARRYRLPSASYDIGDAIIYACMLCYLRPARLVEVGAGSSSALALDIFDHFFAEWPRVAFIEPYPTLLQSLLKPQDRARIEITTSGVQDVPLSYFDELQRDDVLFIDSTHVVKTGSDVVFELFEVLPRLRSGVIVHFHDVFYPFEYPREWAIRQNYSWNEIYALRAFLMGNRDWEIIFFNDYFARVEKMRVERDAPEVLRNPGGGLWLRRC
jgi:hypothetical protein